MTTYLATETATTGDVRKARTFLTKYTAQKFADRSPYRTQVIAVGVTTSRVNQLWAVVVPNLAATMMAETPPPSPMTD